MNRAQRRAAEKRGKVNKYAALMPKSPLEYQVRLAMAESRGDAKGFGHGVDSGVRLSMGIMLLALLDKGHIDKDDVEDAWEHVVDLSDSVKKKYLSPDDIYRALLDEYGVRI